MVPSWKLKTLRVHLTQVGTRINYNYRLFKVEETRCKVKQKYSMVSRVIAFNQRNHLILDTWPKNKDQFMNCWETGRTIILSRKWKHKLKRAGIILTLPLYNVSKTIIMTHWHPRYRYRHQPPFNNNTKALWKTNKNITSATIITSILRCPYLLL